MSEPQQVKSKRELIGERLRNKYPDREYADDEAIFGQIGDDYDEYEKMLDGAREREQKLVDLFNTNPHGAHFLTDMVRGDDPWCGLIERIGLDGMTDMINDPAKREAFAESNRKFMERVAREKELEAEYDSNLEESLRMFERKQAEMGLSDEVVDQVADFLKQIANEVILGKFTEENFDMALKALNHDKDIEAASLEGEIRGRNTRVEERLRRAARSDGAPSLAGANNMQSISNSGTSIFDMAKAAR